MTATEARVRPEPTPAPRRAGRRARLVRGALLVAIVGALACYVLLVAGGGAPQPSPAGLPDPGALTGWLLPADSVLGDLLAAAVVGSLLVPLLTMRRVEDPVDDRGRRAVAAAGWLAAAWAGTAVLELLLVASDQFAVPLAGLDPGLVGEFALDSDQGRMLVLQAAMTAMIALGTRWTPRVRSVGFLLGLALLSTVPPVFSGHAASAGSHDTAILSLLVHVLAVVVWTGGLVALWWHLEADDEVRRRAARRFSSLAVWCFAVTTVSGSLNALVRLGGLEPLVTSGYGRGVLAKVVALAVLAAVAYRTRAVIRSRPGSGWRQLSLLTGIELIVIAAAVGLGVALSRTPPPLGVSYTSVAESLLGGPVPSAPTTGQLIGSFTVSGIGLAVCLLGSLAYLAGVVTLRRRGEAWPVARTLAWFAGLLVVGYVTCGGLGVYGPVLFSAHMAGHMLLSMVAPLLLVLGSPVNLALRALPGSDVPGGTGPRQLLAGALRSRPARAVAHPLVATGLFVGSTYAVYLTPLFGVLMENHLGHTLMEVHFLLTGYLFYEVLVGTAPVRERPPYLARVGLLLVTLPLHAFFALAVMQADPIIGRGYYEQLDRGYRTDLAADQYLGGSLTWAMGEVPAVLLLVVLVAQWFRADRRESQRYDRRAARDEDAELAAYNRRLQALAGQRAGESRDGGHPLGD